MTRYPAVAWREDGESGLSDANGEAGRPALNARAKEI